MISCKHAKILLLAIVGIVISIRCTKDDTALSPALDPDPAPYPVEGKFVFSVYHGNILWGEFDSSEIYVIENSVTTQIKAFRLTSDGNYIVSNNLRWSPDGNFIVFIGGAWPDSASLEIIKSDGSAYKTLLDLEYFGWLGSPTWAADGSQVAYTRRRDTLTLPVNRVFVRVDINNLSEQISTVDPIPGDMDWSPVNSKRIIYTCGACEGIYLLDIPSGLSQSIIQAADKFYSNPRWSPDGSRIAYVRKASETSTDSIFVANANGSDERFLTEGEYPMWSADGEAIAYTTIYTPRSLRLMRLDGNMDTLIAFVPYKSYGFDWHQ